MKKFKPTKKVKKQIRGFSAMTPERRREICQMGGNACHEKHGAKHMAKIGRLGGLAIHEG